MTGLEYYDKVMDALEKTEMPSLTHFLVAEDIFTVNEIAAILADQTQFVFELPIPIVEPDILAGMLFTILKEFYMLVTEHRKTCPRCSHKMNDQFKGLTVN